MNECKRVTLIQISLPDEYFGKERPYRKDPLRREDTEIRDKEKAKHLVGIYIMQWHALEGQLAFKLVWLTRNVRIFLSMYSASRSMSMRLCLRKVRVSLVCFLDSAITSSRDRDCARGSLGSLISWWHGKHRQTEWPNTGWHCKASRASWNGFQLATLARFATWHNYNFKRRYLIGFG